MDSKSENDRVKQIAHRQILLCNCQIKHSVQAEIYHTSLLTKTPRLHELLLRQTSSRFTCGISHSPG